jgi:hypothetical protein
MFKIAAALVLTAGLLSGNHTAPADSAPVNVGTTAVSSSAGITQ